MYLFASKSRQDTQQAGLQEGHGGHDISAPSHLNAFNNTLKKRQKLTTITATATMSIIA